MQFCTNVNINYPEGCEGMIDSCGCYTKEQIDAIVATKLAIADVIDALDSTDATKPLSAAQGKALKTLINNLTTLLNSDNVNLDTLQEIVDFIELNRATLDTLSIGNIAGLQNALNAKADAGHNHDSVYAVIGHTHQLKTINMQDISGIGNISLVGTSELPAYSTSEVLTSERWTDGKPLYKKTINFGTLPNNTSKNVAHNIANAETIFIDLGKSYIPFSDTFFAIYYNYLPNSSSPRWAVTQTNVNCVSFSDLSALTSCYITILYTKTTDTVASPVALVGSVENITTGVEYLVPKIIDGKQVYGMRIYCGAMPNATIKDVAIPNFNNSYTYFVNASGSHCIHPYGFYSIPQLYTTGNAGGLNAYVNRGASAVRLIAGDDWSSATGYVTIHYTK